MGIKLTVQILCAYLPFEVKVKHASRIGNIKKEAILTVSDLPWLRNQAYLKLLLRPLSSLDKPLEELGGVSVLDETKKRLEAQKYGWPTIYTHDWEAESGIFILNYGNSISIRCVPDYYMVPLEAFEIIRETLLSLHFDLFNLIESGDALNLEEHNGN